MSRAVALCLPAEPLLVRERMACTVTAANRARRIVRQQVSWPEIDTAIMIINELVTNTFRHSRSAWLELTIGLTADEDLHICVTDEGRGLTVPHLRSIDNANDQSGRGMLMVDRCSKHWGSGRDSTGVHTWCVIPCTLSPEPAIGYESVKGAEKWYSSEYLPIEEVTMQERKQPPQERMVSRADWAYRSAERSAEGTCRVSGVIQGCPSPTR